MEEIKQSEENNHCGHLESIESFCMNCTVYTCRRCSYSQHLYHTNVEISHLIAKKLAHLEYGEEEIKNFEKRMHSSYHQLPQRIRKAFTGVLDSANEEYRRHQVLLENQLKDEIGKIQLGVQGQLRKILPEVITMKERILEKIQEAKTSHNRGSVIARIKGIEKVAEELGSFKNYKEILSKIEDWLANDHIPVIEANFTSVISSIETKIKQLIEDVPRIYHVPSDYRQISPRSLCFVNNTHFFSFDPVTLKQTLKIQHNTPGIHYQESTSIMTRDSRFFVTGSNLNPRTIKYEFNFEERKMVPRANMINGRSYHAIDEIRHNILLVTAGYTSHTINTCEVYDVLSNIWKAISSLKASRYLHTCFTFEDRYTYVYGGHNGSTGIFSFEKIEFDKDFSGEWTLFNLSMPSSSLSTFDVLSIKTSEHEALIMGIHYANCTKTTECSVFNRQTNQLSLSPHKLANCDSRLHGSAIAYSSNKKFYAFNQTSGLHIFDGEKWVYRADFAT